MDNFFLNETLIVVVVVIVVVIGLIWGIILHHNSFLRLSSNEALMLASVLSILVSVFSDYCLTFIKVQHLLCLLQFIFN